MYELYENVFQIFHPSIVHSFSAVMIKIIIEIMPIIYWWTFLLYMLDESICHFRGVTSILWLLFFFDGKSC